MKRGRVFDYLCFSRKKIEKKEYDKSTKKPVIKADTLSEAFEEAKELIEKAKKRKGYN